MSIRELRTRIWYFFNRERVTHDLEEEMRIHVQFRAESLQKASLGRIEVGEGIAYANARRRFGNATTMQQRSRDMWGFMRLEDFVGDVKFSFRRLSRQPAFAISVIGVMAIGIGASTAMFSAVDAALLRPLPFGKPEQLVTLPDIDVPFDAGTGQPRAQNSRIDLLDTRNMPELFSSTAAYAAGGLNLADPENPARLKAGVVTSNFFSTLEVKPFIGRTFVGEEGKPGGGDVVVLSYGLWQRQYGGRDIKGIRVTLSTRTFEVIGVMPKGFGFPKESDLWIPMSVPTTFQTYEAFRNFLPTTTFARMANGVDFKSASARLMTKEMQRRPLLDSLSKTYFDEMIAQERAKGAVRPLQRELVGDQRNALFVLLGATGLLLLIACVNVTNLLLSHASQRHRELAVRQVLGATRIRIIRQLLTESVLLSVAGAVIGIVVAPLALSLMRALMPASLVGLAPASLDLRVLAFAALLAVVTGVAFGLWPALGSANKSDSEVIKSGNGHGATAAGAGRARCALVSAELALAVMLLIGAGLMLRSFDKLLNRDNGMRTNQVATLELTIPRSSGGRAALLQNIDGILRRLSSLPGIEAAGVVNDLPLSGSRGIGLMISGQSAIPKQQNSELNARYILASGGYFKAMGIPLLSGRVFTVADDSLAPRTAVIAKSMANKMWPGLAAVGRRFEFGLGGGGGDGRPFTVIGVVADVVETKLESTPDMQMYISAYSQTPNSLAIVARGTLPEHTLLAHLKDAVLRVDKSQAVFNVRMMDEVVSKSVAPRRTNTLLIAAFAALALLLASVGVYAVVSHGVSHRTRELGIRSALGASGSDLVRLISSEMLWVTIIGIVVGLAGAWALAKTLSSLVYGVDVHDGFTFAIVPLALIIPTLLATLLPARRVLRLNPAEVMRAE
ncbi:MAG: ABC transporter permease [Gemmatimonadaceae bacterium]